MMSTCHVTPCYVQFTVASVNTEFLVLQQIFSMTVFSLLLATFEDMMKGRSRTLLNHVHQNIGWMSIRTCQSNIRWIGICQFDLDLLLRGRTCRFTRNFEKKLCLELLATTAAKAQSRSFVKRENLYCGITFDAVQRSDLIERKGSRSTNCH